MAQLGKTWINGFVRSAEQTGDFTTNAQGKVIPEYRPTFVTGFTDGQGWALQDTTPDAHGGGGSYLEVDNMRVRGTMSVYELVIQKVRAICGSLGISQACGKVERVDYDAKYYYLTMEGGDTHGYGGFMAGDFVRCQRWTEGGAKGYWVQIKSVSGAVLTIDKGEFDAAIVTQSEAGDNLLGAEADYVSRDYEVSLTNDGGDELTNAADAILLSGETAEDATNIDGFVYPAAGDDLVQYGSATNTARQSAVYIHADEQGKPAVDILMGIKSKSFKGCLSVRLGAGLPNVNGLPTSSVGLYAKNGHIVAMDDDGNTLYELSPDGSFNLGKGAIQYDPTTGKVALSSDVSLTWGSVGNVTDEDGKTISERVKNAETAAKDAAEAAAAIPKFVTDWNTNATSITGTSIATPQAAIGSKDSEGKFTGIVMGNTDTNGYQFAAYSDNEAKVIIDPKTGTYIFKGTIFADAGNFSNCTIEETCTITKIEATSGTIGGLLISRGSIGTDPNSASGGSYSFLTDNGELALGGDYADMTMNVNLGGAPFVFNNTRYKTLAGSTEVVSIYNNQSTSALLDDGTPFHAHVALKADGNVRFNAPFFELYDGHTFGDSYQKANTRIIGFGRNVTEVGADEKLKVDYYHDIIKITGENAVLYLRSLESLNGKEIVIITADNGVKLQSYGTSEGNIKWDGTTNVDSSHTIGGNRILHAFYVSPYWYII